MSAQPSDPVSAALAEVGSCLGNLNNALTIARNLGVKVLLSSKQTPVRGENLFEITMSISHHSGFNEAPEAMERPRE